MVFVCTESMRSYMEEKKKNNISVEVAESNSSDFEVTELYLRLVSDDFRDYLVSKKRYRVFQLEGGGNVLLPPYRLEYDDVVTFDIKKLWLFKRMIMHGIRL